MATRKKREYRLRWSRWLLATLLLLPLSFGGGYAVAALVLFPVPELDTGDLVAVPRLTGQPLSAVAAELEALGLTLGAATELPHLTEPAGTVTAQSPLPGQRLHLGASVRIAVSTGRPQLPVPDLVGLPYQLAASLAEGLGFTVNRREEPGSGAAGIVVGIEPALGTLRELPATIMLIVSAPREPDPVETGTEEFGATGVMDPEFRDLDENGAAAGPSAGPEGAGETPTRETDRHRPDTRS